MSSTSSFSDSEKSSFSSHSNKDKKKNNTLQKLTFREYFLKEFEQRKETIFDEKLDFSITISFISYFKILLEIHKKISKTLDFFILRDFSTKREGLFISNSEKEISLRSTFYKESFIEFYTKNDYTSFTLTTNDLIERLKEVKRNYYLRIFGIKNETGDTEIYFSNIPFFPIKINKFVASDKGNENFSIEVPYSGVLYSFSKIALDDNTKKAFSSNFSIKSLDEFSLKREENLYLESMEVQDIEDFVINSNFFCKILSSINKKKCTNIMFTIEKLISPNSVFPKYFLKIKPLPSSAEIPSLVFYNYESFDRRDGEEYTVVSTENYTVPVSNLVYFIKIKNLNEETNNNIKLRFYKKAIFIESIVNNCGLFSICIQNSSP